MSVDCRHQFRVEGYIVAELGRTSARAMVRFAVFQGSRCALCLVQGHRLLSTVRAIDGWEAARLAGVPEADIDSVNIRSRGRAAAPEPTVAAPTRGLSCWPFPVSAHEWSTP